MQRPLPAGVDPPHVRLHHGRESPGVHPGELPYGGVVLVGRVPGGEPGPGTGGRFDHVLVVTGQLDRAPGRQIPRRHDRHTGRPELPEVPLVDVPPHDVGGIDQPRLLRAPLGPRRGLRRPPAVVPGRPDHGEIEPAPVGPGVVPGHRHRIGPGLPQRPGQHRKVPVGTDSGPGPAGDERDTGHNGAPSSYGASTYIEVIEVQGHRSTGHRTATEPQANNPPRRGGGRPWGRNGGVLPLPARKSSRKS